MCDPEEADLASQPVPSEQDTGEYPVPIVVVASEAKE